ncbi:Uncharacterised protein [Bordetella pertussis]|nr:Uncharacterised protein [Bordetella pertussis]
MRHGVAAQRIQAGQHGLFELQQTAFQRRGLAPQLAAAPRQLPVHGLQARQRFGVGPEGANGALGPMQALAYRGIVALAQGAADFETVVAQAAQRQFQQGALLRRARA